MAELLLELFSEEIPARMQPRAAKTLGMNFTLALREANLFKYIENSTVLPKVRTFSTPQRLVAHVTNLPEKQYYRPEDRRGPRKDAPGKAIQGFLKSVGCSLEQTWEQDGYLYARIEKKPLSAAEALAQALPSMIEGFHWPKSMRWGSGRFRWVRPLHSILCILNGKVVPFEVGGIKSSNRTSGHRFLSTGTFSVKDFADYRNKLENAKVILSNEDRTGQISEKLKNLHEKQGLTYDIDDNLIEEVSNLVEWPVVLLGGFDKSFLELPEEVLISEMRHHQKYFSLTKDGKLAPKFAFISNIPGANGGRAIVAGNERVLSARLYDAKFFWDQDRKVKLEERLPLLQDIVFHEKLGSVAGRTLRIGAIVKKIAPAIPGCDATLAARAVQLAKADLVSGMVGEFPDLQGFMGGYYALEQGEDAAVAEAIRDQYSPKGPTDSCPNAPVSVCLALADKLELLTSMFGIDEKPTGSKDPFALRRAALGVIRLIVENSLRIGLQKDLGVSDELMDFFADRLKVQQREKGVRHDLIDAVFSVGGEDDLVRLLARVAALQDFLKTKDGEVLLYSYKRAVNIVKIEEKKDGLSYSGKIDAKLLKEKEELTLYQGLEEEKKSVAKALEGEQFEQAMAAIATLRKPIDDFFDKVTVNVDDKEIRANRLRLLSGIREALMPVADFSKIES